MSETVESASVGSNVPPETLLFYTHQLTRSKRKIHEANSAHRLLVKKAKQDGVPTDAILESIQWARLEPEERRQRLIDRIRIESARNPENGAKLLDSVQDLDTRVSERARSEDSLFVAEQRGYDDGRGGVPADANPYPAGSEFHAIWRRYWNDGQAANAYQLGENARVASTRKQKKAAPTDDSDAEGNVSLPLGDPVPRRRRRRRTNGQQPEQAAA